MEQFAYKHGIKYANQTRANNTKRTSSYNNGSSDPGWAGWLFLAWIFWGLLPPY